MSPTPISVRRRVLVALGVVVVGSACQDANTPVTGVTPTSLAPTDSVPGLMIDADATRILWADQTSTDTTVRLRTRANGVDSTVSGGYAPKVDVGYLSSTGAVLALVRTGNIHEWRAGTLTNLTTGGQGSLHVAGRYAIWQSATTLRLRDLSADTTTVVSGSALSSDVAANGDVVFAQIPPGQARYRVFRYRGGTTTQLTTEADDTLQDTGPLTDGTTVLFSREAQHGSGGSNGRIIMLDAGGETALTPPGGSPIAGRNYRITNGWIAWVSIDASSNATLWSRAPDGTTAQVATYPPTVTHTPSGAVDRTIAQSIFILSLLPDGTVSFNVTLVAPNIQVASPPYSTVKDLGTTSGTVVYVSGKPMLINGTTLFEIK